MTPSPEAFAATMAGYGVGAGTEVVLYDRSNHAWAARVWWMLRVSGFDSAAVLDGGWQKWAAEGRPTSTEATAYPRGEFVPQQRPELLATKAQVREALGEPAVQVPQCAATAGKHLRRPTTAYVNAVIAGRDPCS
jgi:thiosulfate/3-mercaptopyruvate sulfurtransferase